MVIRNLDKGQNSISSGFLSHNIEIVRRKKTQGAFILGGFFPIVPFIERTISANNIEYYICFVKLANNAFEFHH